MSKGAASRHSKCPGCGALLPEINGPTHRYMEGSSACFDLFGKVLAAEYSDALLFRVHRLTVDTYAVQHPGSGQSRQQIQSVGLHLARLYIQMASERSPEETNDVMLGFAIQKASLEWLTPPAKFRVTVADVAPFAGGARHAETVRTWADATWEDWSEHHGYIRDWVATHAPDLA